MKRLLLVALAGWLMLGLAGCETMSGGFGNVPPQVRRFEADQDAVFFAAQAAVRRMDFVLTRTAQAQGLVNARSSLRDTAVFGASRQFTAKIRVFGVEGGSTEVSILLHENAEGDFKTGATSLALRQHGLYDSFFEYLEQALATPTDTVSE